MSDFEQGLEGQYVIVRRPNELRKPYSEKVVNRVGQVEFSHLTKAARRDATVAQVRFTAPSGKTGKERSFTVTVAVNNLRVVPQDYDAVAGAVRAARRRGEAGANARMVTTLQDQCEKYRLEAEALRKQNAALSTQLETTNMHRQGNIWLWHGDGSDDLASMDGRTVVLIRAGQLTALVGAADAGAVPAPREVAPDYATASTTRDPRIPEDMVSFQQLSSILTRQFRNEDNDYLTSIGHWEPDPLAPGQERFVALVAVPLKDWRFYAAMPGVGEVLSDQDTDAVRIEPGAPVRVKDPTKFPFRVNYKVAGRLGHVISVDRPTGDRAVGTALVRFEKRAGVRSKEFEHSLALGDLVIDNHAPTDPQQPD